MKCDRVALIQDGRVLSIDTPQKIREGFSKKLFRIRAEDKYRLLIALRRYPNTNTAYPFGDSMHVTFIDNAPGDSLPGFLESEGISGVTIEESGAGIEDRFLELMNIGTTI